MKSQLLKHYLFKVVPYPIVRRILKHLNFRSLFFSYAEVDSSQYLVQDTNYVYRFHGMEEELGHKVITGFIRQTMTFIKPYKLQREYILDGGKCYIEPKHGWGIRFGTRQLIKDSIIYNRLIEAYYPPLLKFLFFKKRNLKHFPKAVSLHMIAGGEKNYWHLFTNILGVVTLLDKHNFPRDIPLVIPKKLADQKIFKEVVDYSEDLKNRNWVIQENEYILADQVFFCQRMLNQKDQFARLLDLLRIPDADKNVRRKIYVYRNPKRIRFINNDNEIQEVVRRYGFEVLDCDELNFAEQVELFQQCSHIVSIHGAGLTNIVWRRNAPMTILELFPENYVQPTYFWLAKNFGKTYYALTGGKTLPDSSFYLNPEKLEQKLKQILSTENTAVMSR